MGEEPYRGRLWPFYGMHEKERVRSVCFDSTIEKKIEKKRRFLRRIEDASSYSRRLFTHMFDEISPLNSLSDIMETWIFQPNDLFNYEY
jgi:hypothetical protein